MSEARSHTRESFGRHKLGRLLATGVLAAMVSVPVLAPGTAHALPLDGSNPNGCSATTVGATVITHSGTGVIIGEGQSRYSSSCKLAWTRTCAKLWYTPGNPSHTRTSPSLANPQGQFAGAGNACGAAYFGSNFSKATESRCYLSYGYLCSSYGYTDIYQSGVLMAQTFTPTVLA